MSIPRSVLIEIGHAVEAHGGTLADAEHLADEWERLRSESEPVPERPCRMTRRPERAPCQHATRHHRGQAR